MAKKTYNLSGKEHPRPGSKIRFHDGKEEVDGTVAFSGKKQIHVRHGKTGEWHKLTIVHEDNIDEISKETLDSYRTKAIQNHDTHQSLKGPFDKTVTKRRIGIRKAALKVHGKEPWEIKEEGECPTNTVGSGNIAGANQDPPGSKKSKFKIMARKYPNV